MDLSPREVVPTAPSRARKRPWLAFAVLGLVLVAGGVMVAQFLTNAVDYYCNVDEVGVKDGCDIGRNIRIQGVVQGGSVEKSEAGALVALVTDVVNFLSRRDVTVAGTSAKRREVRTVVLCDPEHLEKYRVFTSVLRITYSAAIAVDI